MIYVFYHIKFYIIKIMSKYINVWSIVIYLRLFLFKLSYDLFLLFLFPKKLTHSIWIINIYNIILPFILLLFIFFIFFRIYQFINLILSISFSISLSLFLSISIIRTHTNMIISILITLRSIFIKDDKNY